MATYSAMLLLWAVILGVAGLEETPADAQPRGDGDFVEPEGSRGNRREFDGINFVVYTPERNISYAVADAPKLLEFIDSSKPTVIYLHGWRENNESVSVGVVSRAFLHRGSHNFVLVDYGAYVRSPYSKALSRLPSITEVVAEALNGLVEAGLSTERLWLVGHSLGGQLCGALPTHLDFRIPRITALDPAFPGFGVGFDNLDEKDADYVDVVHTDAGGLGYNRPCGHADFWPNGGASIQPGCPRTEAGCSHFRSWYFFAESVVDDEAFPAVLCGSWRDFARGRCPLKEDNYVYLGYKCDQSKLRGNFYMTTNTGEPFGLGRSGLV